VKEIASSHYLKNADLQSINNITMTASCVNIYENSNVRVNEYDNPVKIVLK
jgi:hypothetical protein